MYQYNSVIVSFMKDTRQATGWRDPAVKGGFAQPSAHDLLTLLSDEDALEADELSLQDILDGASEDGTGVRIGDERELELAAMEEVLDEKALDKLQRQARAHFSEVCPKLKSFKADNGRWLPDGNLDDLREWDDELRPRMTDAWRDEVGPWRHEFTIDIKNAAGEVVGEEEVVLGYQGGESVDDPGAANLAQLTDNGYFGWLLGQNDLEALGRDIDWQMRQEMLERIRSDRTARVEMAAVLLSLADDEDAKALLKVIKDTTTESRKRCGNGVVDKTPGQHLDVRLTLREGRIWDKTSTVVPNATGTMQLKGCWWHVYLRKQDLEVLEAMVPEAKAEADAAKAASAARWTAKQERIRRFEACMAWLAKPQTDASLTRAAKAFVARYWGASDGSTVGSITRAFKTGDWSDVYMDTKQGAAVKVAFSNLGYSTKRGW